MDNFFQILFLLFIIFSFLAPLFKKKPEEQQRKKTQPPDDNTNSSGAKPSYSPKVGNEDYDILSEIEGMFNSQRGFPKTSEVKIPDESEVNNRKKEIQYETSPSESDITEHSIDEEWHRPTTEADYARETAIIEEEAKRFEKMLNEKKEDVNRIREKIKETIKTPESLKEYFVISEILGTPKGFEKN